MNELGGAKRRVRGSPGVLPQLSNDKLWLVAPSSRGRLLNFRLRPFDDDEADIVSRFCKIQDVCLDTFEDLPRSLML